MEIVITPNHLVLVNDVLFGSFDTADQAQDAAVRWAQYVGGTYTIFYPL